MIEKINKYCWLFLLFACLFSQNSFAYSSNDFSYWYKLGKEQSREGKLDEALNSFHEASKLSKNNNDVMLEIARINIWQSDYKDGEKKIDKILKENPDYLDAKILKARSFYYQGKLDESMKILSILRTKHNENKEIDSLYSQVNKAISSEKKTKKKISFATGGSESRFRQSDKKNWESYFVQGNYGVTKNLTLHLKGETEKRGESTNEYLETGGIYVKKNNYVLSGAAGVTHESSFLPAWRLKLNAKKLAYKNDNFLVKELWPYINFQYDSYKTNIVKKYYLGLSTRVFKSWIFDYSRILIYDNQHDTLYGWSARLDYELPFRNARIYYGLSDAPETGAGQTVRTKSSFYGVAIDIFENVAFYGGYAREDRADSYIKDLYSGTIMVKF